MEEKPAVKPLATVVDKAATEDVVTPNVMLVVAGATLPWSTRKVVVLLTVNVGAALIVTGKYLRKAEAVELEFPPIAKLAKALLSLVSTKQYRWHIINSRP